MALEIFEDRIWQMSLGERAAVEGVLAHLRPALAIEIGTAEGAALARIAAHAAEVHSFDLVPPQLGVADNVTLHTGDSHELLPRFLTGLAEQQRQVDFVLVDGDHSPEGVRRDLEDLLDSPSLARTVILVHDTANERVRSGIEDVRFEAWPKVAHVELDWIPGQLFAEPKLRHELWYGLGLIVVDTTHLAYRTGPVHQQRYVPAGPLLAEVRDLVRARELVPEAAEAGKRQGQLHQRVLEQAVELSQARMREVDQAARLVALDRELTDLRTRTEEAERQRERDARTLREVMGSPSWRLTEPLRRAKRVTRRKP